MDYMTVPQAAKELGLSEAGIRRRIERGEMEATLVSPRLWMIPNDEVERWREIGSFRVGPQRDFECEYGRFNIQGRMTTSQDGRFGRCWFNMYRRLEDREPAFAFLAIVSRRASTMLTVEHNIEAEELAQRVGWSELKAGIDAQQYEDGKTYRLYQGADGHVQRTVHDLDDPRLR